MGIWDKLFKIYGYDRARKKGEPWSTSIWFRERNIPEGTAFNARYRAYDWETVQLYELIEGWELNPWNPILSIAVNTHGAGHAEKYFKNLDALERLVEFSHLMQTNVVDIMPKSDPDYPAHMEKLAASSPRMYFRLGSYHFRRRQDDEALRAYRLGFEKTADRELVAHWSVQYLQILMQRGEEEEAAKVAAEIAKVDQKWLQFAIVLYELDQRKFAEAHARAIHIAKEHGDTRALASVWYQDPDKSQRQRLVGTFSNSLELPAFDPKEIGDTPPVGLELGNGAGGYADQSGAGYGDVVVAVNGLRVRDRTQYDLVAYSTLRKDHEFTIWNKYSKEVRTITPRLSMGGDFEVGLYYHDGK